MNNVISIAEKIHIDTRKEIWNRQKTNYNKEWTRKEYVSAYIKLLSNKINK